MVYSLQQYLQERDQIQSYCGGFATFHGKTSVSMGKGLVEVRKCVLLTDIHSFPVSFCFHCLLSHRIIADILWNASAHTWQAGCYLASIMNHQLHNESLL